MGVDIRSEAVVLQLRVHLYVHLRPSTSIYVYLFHGSSVYFIPADGRGEVGVDVGSEAVVLQLHVHLRPYVSILFSSILWKVHLFYGLRTGGWGR